MSIHRQKNIFENLLKTSPSLKDIVDKSKRAALTSSNIVIIGESGTGKEVIARGIHEYSGRKGTFVAINLSAVTQELFEAEIFGYVEGAFTGANKKGKIGFLEMANGGTLLMDEVSDMPLYGQVKMLRVLQEREYVKVGDDKYCKLDLRVIAAANRPLKELVAEGKFRQDLYYRLNVIEIILPPLRERVEDIPLLLDLNMDNLSRKNSIPPKTFDNNLLDFLLVYRWPGNIREMMNVIESMVISSPNRILGLSDLPSYMTKGCNSEVASMDIKQAVERLEVDYIKNALKMAKNNRAEAARILNLPRATLYKKINDYGLE